LQDTEQQTNKMVQQQNKSSLIEMNKKQNQPIAPG